ncbi:MAG TPA: anaerobic ribonucleoside-triphosphate reductase activating protein [Candidatus Magasanikbacteria bacterium]|nr:MAG: anaerobic ribonucleoside-triphosphate reductase activating protein [Candidatus Magasanikbacteria bacterium RIFCSPLOWO2_02_FULL_47_16]OGH80277.1 MAG: anaerobic ribonucleoside-triphosphate reductase activating protein [Candidatus Magasanikbacteria bacterium RIFCSPHIGHO2_02_FULL_48_18]OGH82261.1 MAG: anaerobic ribonucleoside-triphosphate reductase activating protein [Candidatus Magasanikbacteria bacterium RIFCSPLOWO2_12_FULL_47_9b]HAZ28692.1 anaerobic ribonucleoside-triphosphate reductase a
MLISGIQKFTILDYPEKTACVVFTPGCNFRCGYCHNPEFVLPEKIQAIRSSFIPEETFFHFLEERVGFLEGVVISGGEPTMQGDLLDFIRRIRARGFLVKLDTNGNNPERLKQIMDEGLLDYVAMDVKISLAAYLGLVGPRAKTQALQQSIALLMQSSVPYEFRSTLIKEIHSEEILENMAQLIAGAACLFLQSFRPGHTLDESFSAYHAFSGKEMERIQALFERTVAKVVIR